MGPFRGPGAAGSAWPRSGEAWGGLGAAAGSRSWAVRGTEGRVQPHGEGGD